MSNPKISFAKHYVEMVLVMLAGMFVLGGALLLGAAALGFGYDQLRDDAPVLILLGMGFSMTAPMIWWMHRRGHSWPATRAMALAMAVPALGALALMAGGATDLHGALMLEHIVMFPAMLGAMVPYRAEFAHGVSSAVREG
jgi:predicted membrane protein